MCVSVHVLAGMCPELVDLYALTMTHDALPFPSTSNRSSILSQSQAEPEVEVDDIEMTRGARRSSINSVHSTVSALQVLEGAIFEVF